MQSIQSLYDIRDITTLDENFVYSTFLRGLYYGNEFFNMIPKDIFMTNYKPVANHLIKDRTKTVVKIASLKDDPNIIIGYSILSADYSTIHYVYVKEKFRKQGIAKSLVPKYPTYISHFTTVGKTLFTKFDNCTFNPFSL